MKQLSPMKILCLAVAAATLSACGPSKILIGHAFLDSEKSAKSLMLPSEAKLFKLQARVCDVTPKNGETNCKDSDVLDNVVPGSIY